MMGQLALSAAIGRCLLETTAGVGNPLRNKNCLTARNSIYPGIFLSARTGSFFYSDQRGNT